MVDLFAIDLGGETCYLRVGGRLEAREAFRVGSLVEIVARDRLLPVQQS